MTLSEWRFSAQLAWQDLFIRWVTIVSALAAVVTSIFILWKLIPEGVRSGVLTMHYTIYLGIDDVRPWPWIFIIPTLLLFILMMNTVLSFGLYRRDVLAARALSGLSLAVVLITSISSFFPVLINV